MTANLCDSRGRTGWRLLIWREFWIATRHARRRRQNINIVPKTVQTCFCMASLRQTSEAFLLSHAIEVIDEEEFLLLWCQWCNNMMSISQRIQVILSELRRLFLDSMTEDECKSEFRFLKNDVYLLAETLDIPDAIKWFQYVNLLGLKQHSSIIAVPHVGRKIYK